MVVWSGQERRDLGGITCEGIFPPLLLLSLSLIPDRHNMSSSPLPDPSAMPPSLGQLQTETVSQNKLLPPHNVSLRDCVPEKKKGLRHAGTAGLVRCVENYNLTSFFWKGVRRIRVIYFLQELVEFTW